jgi:diguanylate cyclase (GGDEF)-like protein
MVSRPCPPIKYLVDGSALQRDEERRLIFADWKVVVGQAFLDATHDPLTGLPNRALFHDRLKAALSESKRHQEVLGILFLDLDHFKKVNDLLGHDAGDEILTAVGSRLTQVMRSEETIARVGGDEFVALIRRLRSPQEAETVAARLLKALAAPFLLRALSFAVSASIGISLYPFDGMDGELLLRQADDAMFRVKKRGGNGLEYFEKPTEASQEPVRSKKAKENTSKRKILIVDDDPDFQLVLKNCLKKEGYSCVSAVGVEEALESVRINAPDLVILDLGLRRASGLAFLQNFASVVSSGERIPPVLVVSGHNDPEIVDFAMTLGASRFIPKPTGSFEIVSAVRSFIQ